MDDSQNNPIAQSTSSPVIHPKRLRQNGSASSTVQLINNVDNSVDKLITHEGGQPGNTNNTKWKTPEERRNACEEVCKELRLGYPREYLYTASWKTIARYMREYPVDFPTDKIEEAEKDGIRRLLSIGYGGMAGKVPGFNSRTWEFIIQNRSKWKLRHDTTTNDKELPTPILGTAAKDTQE